MTHFTPAQLASLSPALRAVYELLVRGLRLEQIGALRKTSRGAVTKQVDALYRSLGVRSRRELLARAPLR